MSDKKINIVYIDDNSDEILSQYMTKEYCATPFQQPDITQIEKVYKEVRFVGMKVMKHYSKMLLLKLQM